jgi:hypothetical protein
MPFVVLLIIPNLCAIGQRFIMQIMVEDKQTKMRETLRMMSLGRVPYGLSVVVFQGFFALLSGLFMAIILWGDPYVFSKDDSGPVTYLAFALAVTLMILA